MLAEGQRPHILVVDDEPFNREIIQRYLSSQEYELSSASNGHESIKMLTESPERFDVVLLDRKMPDIDGIEVLHHIKHNQKLKNIPVIMQTVLDDLSEISEGIRAGAYYYLTKPFEEEMLLSIIEAAITDIKMHQINYEEPQKELMFFNIVDRCEMHIRTLHDAKRTAFYLSHLYPEPERVLFGIHELLINAVEHGNLGIGYERKTGLVREGSWLQEIDKRLCAPENLHKNAYIEYKRNKTDITLYIRDSGKGFDWKEYMEISPRRAADNHGRGIALANITSFDRLIYNDAGNEVWSIVNY